MLVYKLSGIKRLGTRMHGKPFQEVHLDVCTLGPAMALGQQRTPGWIGLSLKFDPTAYHLLTFAIL